MAFTRALYEVVLGMGLLLVPWSRLWNENWLVWASGPFRHILLSGPFRGAISGLGAAILLGALAERLSPSLLADDPGQEPRAEGPSAPAPEPRAGERAPCRSTERGSRVSPWRSC
jgi:hypothetical protein